jgi:hypothetical protein
MDSIHMGDVDFTTEDSEGDIADASWEEVARTCCVHSPAEWGYIFLGLCLVLSFLYFFLFGLELLMMIRKNAMGGTHR